MNSPKRGVINVGHESPYFRRLWESCAELKPAPLLSGLEVGEEWFIEGKETYATYLPHVYNPMGDEP